MKRFKITVNDKIYTVEVGDVHASPITVKVDGEKFAVRVEQELAVETTPVASPTAPVSPVPASAPVSATPVSAGTGEIIAPMPGTIMDIAVRTGDVVKHGQQLCNLEAMKMKSPIRSTTTGRVVEVRASEGQSVNYGDVLFVVKADN